MAPVLAGSNTVSNTWLSSHLKTCQKGSQALVLQPSQVLIEVEQSGGHCDLDL
jgi:hypothetical protein